MKPSWWGRVLPSGLSGRIVLVLMVGLTLFHIGSLWLHQVEITSLRGEARGHQMSNVIVLAHRILETNVPEDREGIAHAMSLAGLELHWGKIPTGGLEAQGDGRPERLARQLREQLPEQAANALRLNKANDSDKFHALLGAVPLSDGSWLNFSVATFRPLSLEHLTLLSTTAMGIGILLLSLIVVRLIGRPLRALSDAADRIGLGDRLPSLPETGPYEVQHAARAFNKMQERIDQMINDRTQALAAVSHDLRTPIARLRMRAGFIDDAELQQRMDADLDEMDGMIESTLSYLRGTRDGEPVRPVNLAAILETLCDDAADQGGTARYDGPPQVRIMGQPLALKRAFANLIDNAMKYGSAARVTCCVEATGAVVEISDEGPGIPQEDLTAVFEPFHRLDLARCHGGTGLGLTIARRIIEVHHGTIVLRNRPEGGLSVRVCLPDNHSSENQRR